MYVQQDYFCKYHMEICIICTLESKLAITYVKTHNTGYL